MRKAYLRNSNVELEVRDFFSRINEHGIVCRFASCYAKAFDSIEEVPLNMIELR